MTQVSSGGDCDVEMVMRQNKKRGKNHDMGSNMQVKSKLTMKPQQIDH